MVLTMSYLSNYPLLFLCCVAALYVSVAAGISFVARPKGRGRWRSEVPPVSVLKPLCGAEPRLFENLATFCEQTHPHYQLLFGVSSTADSAVAVVRRLQAAYPSQDIVLVIDSLIHGPNLKVSNLINLAAQAKHDLLIVADSDIAVEPDYLERVIAPLADSQVGVVTCLYRARSIGGFWPRTGVLFINEWFAPAVRVAQWFGSQRFGFGATLAMRASTLARIGGFQALKDCLADDYWLAERTRELGLTTVLSDVVVATDVVESNFRALWLRETRWLRTIRSINPLGFAFLFITFTSPWLVASVWLSYSFKSAGAPFSANVCVMMATLGALARFTLAIRTAWEDVRWRASPTSGGRVYALCRNLLLAPLRDGLLMLQWLAAAFGSHVVWRGARVPVVARVMQGPDSR